jgi:predicted RNA-binding Zn-ribbon protein involved in translation (DUF1610 family)
VTRYVKSIALTSDAITLIEAHMREHVGLNFSAATCELIESLRYEKHEIPEKTRKSSVIDNHGVKVFHIKGQVPIIEESPVVNKCPACGKEILGEPGVECFACRHQEITSKLLTND